MSSITVQILADSVSSAGVRLTSFEVEFPRYILSEYNTHRVFSRSAASTRAIPILKMLEQIAESPAMPIYYGKNQAGMAAKEELSVDNIEKCKNIIDEMRLYCTEKVKELHSIGLHKQHAGRYIEPWQMVKGVVSSTEWDNFFWLRNDEAAQPEIKELARCMQEARNQSEPEKLHQGEWHLPYITTARVADNRLYYIEENNKETYLTLDEAIIVSCARCAAVSFRNVDYDLEKSKQVFDRLLNGGKIHGSAFEHCATPIAPKYLHYYNEYDDLGLVDTKKCINIPSAPSTWQNGISHIDKGSNLWSGNFKGWIQYRKTLKGENYNVS